MARQRSIDSIGKGTAKSSCEPLGRKGWLLAAADAMSNKSGIDAQIAHDGAFCIWESRLLPTGEAS